LLKIKNIQMKTFGKIVFVLGVIALIASCSNPRKCGGKKGIRTPMGVM